MQNQLVASRLSLHFTQSVAANVGYWRRRTQQLTNENLAALDRDRQNLYRAAKFGLHLAATWQETAELILQSFVLVERRGYWREWIPILERLLDRCFDNDLALRGRILDQLGIFYRYDRQLEKAVSVHQEELQTGHILEDRWRQAHACINLGVVYRQMRRFDEAQTHILLAKERFQAINAPPMKHAFVALELGLLAQAQEKWPVAENHLNNAVSLWREVDDPVYLANSLKLLGQVLASQNKIKEALNTYQEALDKLSQTENQLDRSRLLNELGVIYFNEGNLAEAQRLLQQADSAFLRRSGNLLDQAIIATNRGNVYQAQGMLDRAEQAFRHSVAFWKMCDDPVQLANALGGLAEVRTSQGDLDDAQQYYQQAIRLLTGYPHDIWGQRLLRRLQEEENALKHRK